MDLNTSEQHKLKVTYDPGWNDPPTFSYDATKSALQQGKRGNLLNKRVAYPLGGLSSPVSSPGQPPGGDSESPPLKPPILPPSGCGATLCGVPHFAPLPQSPVSKSSEPHQTCDSHHALEKGVEVLYRLVDTLPPDDKREKEDIKKRLGVLRKMCKDDKLNEDIYGRLVQLATALNSGDTTTASNIQAGLMIDHVSVCSSWMSGVRLLVRRIADPDA